MSKRQFDQSCEGLLVDQSGEEPAAEGKYHHFGIHRRERIEAVLENGEPVCDLKEHL